MAEKFQKVVATPEQAAAKLRRKIAGTKPVDYVRKKRAEKNANGETGNAAEFVDAAKIGMLGAGKWSAWLAAGGAQFLLTLARWMTLDNVFLRQMENKLAVMNVMRKKTIRGEDGRKQTEMRSSKLREFAKKYPNFSAHVMWLFGLGLISGGTYLGAEVVPDKIEQFKEWRDVKRNTMAFDDVVLNPRASDEEWQRMVDAVHPYVLAHLVSSEEYVEQIYDDNFGKGTKTIGMGFALMDETHRKFATRVLNQHIGNGFKITKEQSRDLASAWLYEKVYPKIKQHIKAPMDAKLFVILAVAGYNKGENTWAAGNKGNIVTRAINSEQKPQDIAGAYVRAFAEIKGTRWGGLSYKYGMLASYYLGNVSDQDLLNSIAGAPYMMDEYVPQGLLVYDSNSPKARAKAVRQVDSLGVLLQKPRYRKVQGTVQEPIRAYLTDEHAELIANGYVKTGGATVKLEDFINKPAPENLTPAQQLNADGEDFYFDGNYKKAITKFKAALDKDPELYIVYSNLSLCYYKMGQYEDGLRVVQGLIESNYLKGMPNDIRGYTYYNAALCRAALGDKSKDVGQRHEHYVMAMNNLELAKKFSGNQYATFSDELQKKLGRKVAVLQAGIKKIKQNDNHKEIDFVKVAENNKTMA